MKQGRKFKANVGLVFRDWLIGSAAFLVKPGLYRDRKAYLHFGPLMWHTGWGQL